MRSQTAGRRIARGATDFVDTVVNRVRIARKDSAERRERSIAAKKGPSVQERQQELIRFYERYEDLVETLCDAAQYGPTPKLQRSYDGHREWMKENYPSIRPYLVGYLRARDEEPEGRNARGESGDAFEALVSADNLDGFLADDDGGMIGRITRTREALTLYGEHLRQLAARVG